MLKSCRQGIHGLVGCNKGASGQHFDLLGVTDFSTGIDRFLLGFEELLGEVSKLEDFSFDEQVSQSLYRVVDELLVGLSILKDALAEGVTPKH